MTPEENIQKYRSHYLRAKAKRDAEYATKDPWVPPTPPPQCIQCANAFVDIGKMDDARYWLCAAKGDPDGYEAFARCTGRPEPCEDYKDGVPTQWTWEDLYPPKRCDPKIHPAWEKFDPSPEPGVEAGIPTLGWILLGMAISAVLHLLF